MVSEKGGGNRLVDAAGRKRTNSSARYDGEVNKTSDSFHLFNSVGFSVETLGNCRSFAWKFRRRLRRYFLKRRELSLLWFCLKLWLKLTEIEIISVKVNERKKISVVRLLGFYSTYLIIFMLGAYKSRVALCFLFFINTTLSLYFLWNLRVSCKK